jgi:hypothetical protein
MEWRKARLSGAQNGCVSVAFSSEGRVMGLIRDSKSPERGHLTTNRAAFAAFIADIKNGRRDLD